MYYKLMHNNALVDLIQEPQYVRWQPKQKRWVFTDSQSANGVMGGDHNTVYHLLGRPKTFTDDLKTIEIFQISNDEYIRLSADFSIQRKENEDLRREMNVLKEQLADQSRLLELILSKL